MQPVSLGNGVLALTGAQPARVAIPERSRTDAARPRASGRRLHRLDLAAKLVANPIFLRAWAAQPHPCVGALGCRSPGEARHSTRVLSTRGRVWEPGGEKWPRRG